MIGTLLAVNLLFAVGLASIAPGTALINLACAIICALQIHFDTQKDTEDKGE